MKNHIARKKQCCTLIQKLQLMDQKAVSGKAINCCSMLDSRSDCLIDFMLSRLWGFMEIKSSLNRMVIIYTIKKPHHPTAP
jgi:hypothetical protein